MSKEIFYYFLLIPMIINLGVGFLGLSFLFLPIQAQTSKVVQQLFSLIANGGILLLYAQIVKVVAIKTNPDFQIKEEIKNELKIFRKIFKTDKKILVFGVIGSFLVPLVMCYFRILLNVPDPVNDQQCMYFLVIPFLFGPIVEEFLYRKTMYSYCLKHKTNSFIYVSPIFFSLMHGYSLSVYSGICFIQSVLFAFFFLVLPYIITKSVISSIINHVVINMSVLVFLNKNQFLFINAIGYIVFVLCVIVFSGWYLLKRYFNLEEIK